MQTMKILTMPKVRRLIIFACVVNACVWLGVYSFHNDDNMASSMSHELQTSWKHPQDLCSYRTLKSPLIFYNRVSNTGSSTVLGVFDELAEKHPGIKWGHPSDTGDRKLSKRGIMKLAKELFEGRPHNKTYIYDKHVHFVNFSQYGYPMPVYVNTFRDPLARQISSYYYKRFLSPNQEDNIAKKEKKETFEECALKGRRPECGKQHGNSQLKWFCGQDPICKSSGPEALTLAKHNIAQYHAVVAPTEDLGGFFVLLEELMPQVFRGVYKIYKKQGANKKVTSTNSKYKLPSPQVAQMIRNKYLAYDYELHKFLMKTYSNLKQRLAKLSCPAANHTERS